MLDAIAKLRIIYKNIMKLTYDNKRTRSRQTITDVLDIEEKTPLEIFEEFYEKQNNQPMSEEQRRFMVDEIDSIW